MLCDLLLLFFGAQAQYYELSELKLAIDLLAARTKPGTELILSKVNVGPMAITLFNHNPRWLLTTDNGIIRLKRLSWDGLGN